MESSKVGRRLSSSCPSDRSGNSLFRRSWVMATAARARTSDPVRPSFLKWNCSPFRARTNQKLHQSSAAQKSDLRPGLGKLTSAEKFLLRQSFCLKPFESGVLHRGVIAKSCRPAYARLFAKPGELAFGVTPRGLLNRSPRFFQCNLAAEYCAQLAVTDEIKRLRIVVQAALE